MELLDAFVRFLPTLGFLILAAVILGSAWMVSQARRITHAAFFMVLTFTGVAGVYVYLGADFLAGSQVLIYVGAVAVMFLFAIMVSDLKELSDNPVSREKVAPGAASAAGDDGAGASGSRKPAGRREPWLVLSGLVALGFAALVLAALGRAGVPVTEIAAASGEPTTVPIGRALFSTFLIPFEVASIVLLVALVGAVVIAAREDDGRGPGDLGRRDVA